MKTISYYISMVVILAATIFTGCTDDDEKSLSPRAGELSIYDFAPNTGKGGTQLLINGEQFPLDATSISVSINEYNYLFCVPMKSSYWWKFRIMKQ